MEEVDEPFAHTVLEGIRSEEQQAENVARRVSMTLDSNHLPRCSEDPSLGVDAVDLAPDPLSWPQVGKLKQALERHLGIQVDKGQLHNMKRALDEYTKDVARWYYFGGYVLGVADQLHKAGRIGARIRGGLDWDGDRQLSDQHFDDLGHFERVKP